MSSTKAGNTVLRKAWWPCWPRWAPFSSQQRFNRIPAQHRYLSSTGCRHGKLTTLPHTTPKAPLSKAALKQISIFKHFRPSPVPQTRQSANRSPPGIDGILGREGNSATDSLAAFKEYQDRIPARKLWYALGASASDSNIGQAARSDDDDSVSRLYGIPPAPQPPVDYERRLELPPLRLGPSLGRSVTIERAGGMDLARGLNLLKAKINQNQIKSDHIRQRFHERPGLKRKRLRSQRWRKKFMMGFRAMVRQVQHMRRQGW